MLQIFRSVGDDPVPPCARSAPAPSPPPRPGEADQHRRRSPERHRPPPKLPTTIPLKRTVDVGQQPQRRRAGPSRSSRSVCWPSSLESAPPRARVTAAQAVNADLLSVLQIFRSVGDDPVPPCARSAPAPSPPPRPGEADQHRRRSPERHRPPPKLPTTIPLKRTVDVGQQPQRRRAGPSRSSRSVCWPSSLESAPPRARA